MEDLKIEKITGPTGADTAVDKINKQTQQRKRNQENAGVAPVKGFNPPKPKMQVKTDWGIPVKKKRPAEAKFGVPDVIKAKQVGKFSRTHPTTETPFNFGKPAMSDWDKANPKIKIDKPDRKGFERTHTPPKPNDAAAYDKLNPRPVEPVPEVFDRKKAREQVNAEIPLKKKNGEIWSAAKQGWLNSNYDKDAAKRELLYKTDKKLYDKTYNDTFKLTPEQAHHNEVLKKQLNAGQITQKQYDDNLERSWAEMHGGKKNYAYAKAVGAGALKGVAQVVAPQATGLVNRVVNNKEQAARKQYNSQISAMNKMANSQASQYANEIQRENNAEVNELNKDLKVKRKAMLDLLKETIGANNEAKAEEYKKAKAEYEKSKAAYDKFRKDNYAQEKADYLKEQERAYNKAKLDAEMKRDSARRAFKRNRDQYNLKRYKEIGGIK